MSSAASIGAAQLTKKRPGAVENCGKAQIEPFVALWQAVLMLMLMMFTAFATN